MDGDDDRIDADDTLRISAIPERLMNVEPSDEATVDTPGLQAREPDVKDEQRLSGVAGDGKA